MLCTEIGNTCLLNDVKIKQLTIWYEEDKEWEFEKPIFKIMTSFQRKSRIIKYSLDLPLENMICKHDVLWAHAAYRVVRVRSDSAARYLTERKCVYDLQYDIWYLIKLFYGKN